MRKGSFRKLIKNLREREGKTTIGTCWDCEWYGNFQGQSVCTRIIPGHWFVSEREIPKDFGCNKWEGKTDV